MSTQPAGPPRVRTSDAEREDVVTILRAAIGEGRLTLAEGEERIAAAYAATYRDELGPLTTDLPGGGRQALLETPEAKARLAAYARHRLRRHGTFVAVAATVLAGLWVASGAVFFWPAILLAFLAVSLLRHVAWYRRGARWGWSGHRHGRGWSDRDWSGQGWSGQGWSGQERPGWSGRGCRGRHGDRAGWEHAGAGHHGTPGE
ncbi:MAG TPA: DUF1707 domain-containing protein [Micromonosporaceae bacterium]|nr:DUF1707 domain-containing protein [Micromonosporaceae bacterium]